MMLETARFWVSRSSLGDDGRYHIRLVVGPDEYHESVDDNAYTNVLARWNVQRAMEALAWLEKVDSGYAEELQHRLELTAPELFDWRKIVDGLVDGFDPETLSTSSSPGSTAWKTSPWRSCARGRWPPTSCW